MRIFKKIMMLPLVVLITIIEWILGMTIKITSSVGSLLFLLLFACIIHSIITQRWTNLLIALAIGISVLIILFIAVAFDETIKRFLNKLRV